MEPEIHDLNQRLTGRYAISRELARGGMAVVYLARDFRHDRLVALKVLKPELAAAVGRQRFLREIGLTASLDHPHIVPLLDSGEAGDLLFYVMPFVEGESLRDRLNRDGRLDVASAIRIAGDVGDALGFAHGRGIVHRDIKPENILLASGYARVADFGIARAVSAAADHTVTQTGVIVGTPAYMSPEQAMGMTEPDARSDVFSLACVTLEMLTGRKPAAGSIIASVQSASKDSRPRTLTGRDDVPPHVEQALAKGLAADCENRFATTAEFIAALRGVPASPVVTSHRPSGGRLWIASAATLVIVAAAVWIGRHQSAAPSAIDALVVMPFENLSGSPEQQFFVDGMHDALIGELGGIARLRVPSRMTAVAYSRTTTGVDDLANQLDVDAVVTGSVFRARDSVVIAVRLVAPSPERQLWAKTYKGDIRNASSLLSAVAEAIAREIEVRLTRAEETRLARREVVDPVVLELYMQGQHRMRLNQLREAQQYFQRAIERDSTYAPAHAAIAHTYNVMGYYGSTAPSHVYPLARAAATKAIRHDPTLADGHVQLAWTAAVFDWNWPEAESAFRRAVALNPGNVMAHALYAYFLHWHRRDSEAIAEFNQALQLDPTSLVRRASGAGLFMRIRRCDLAQREIAAARDLQAEIVVDRPGYYSPDFTDALCHLQARRPERAVALMRAGLRTATSDMRPRYQADLAHALATMGGTGTAEARTLLRGLHAVRLREYVAPYLIAQVHAGLGEPDSVFFWLGRAYDVRDNWLPFLRVEPRWDPMRRDPRFAELLRRVKLSN